MRRWLASSFLVAVALLLGLEVVVRIAFARSFSGRFEYGYHPSAGFVEESGGRVRLVRAGGRRFWPQSFPREPQAGIVRIMVFGDSVPRGPKPELAYSRYLHEALAKKGISNEVINLSVAGNGSSRTPILLRHSLRYKPHLVILHVNNSNEYEDEREWHRYQEFLSWHPRNWLMKSAMLRRVHEAKTEQAYWRLLSDDIRAQREVNDIQSKLASSLNEAKVAEWNERVRTNTVASVRLVQEQRAAILLISQARRGPALEGSAALRDNGLDEIVRAAAPAPWAFISMKETFAGVNFDSSFADGSHLRPAGHQFLADTLARLILNTPELNAAIKPSSSKR